MQFEAKEDVECSISTLFDKVSDFESFERSALRRGIDVVRNGDPKGALQDLSWDVAFSFRGSARNMSLTISDYQPSTSLALDGQGQGLDGMITVELVRLAPMRTRMVVVIKLKPKTLAARLLIQSLKLARSKLNRRFKARLAEFARAAEDPKFERL